MMDSRPLTIVVGNLVAGNALLYYDTTKGATLSALVKGHGLLSMIAVALICIAVPFAKRRADMTGVLSSAFFVSVAVPFITLLISAIPTLTWFAGPSGVRIHEALFVIFVGSLLAFPLWGPMALLNVFLFARYARRTTIKKEPANQAL